MRGTQGSSQEHSPLLAPIFKAGGNARIRYRHAEHKLTRKTSFPGSVTVLNGPGSAMTNKGDTRGHDFLVGKTQIPISWDSDELNKRMVNGRLPSQVLPLITRQPPTRTNSVLFPQPPNTHTELHGSAQGLCQILLCQKISGLFEKLRAGDNKLGGRFLFRIGGDPCKTGVGAQQPDL